jgi:hypothetical protein
MSDDTDHIEGVVAVALDIADELGRRLPARTGGRFRIAMAGGMALQTSLSGVLQITSEATDMLALLLEAGPPPDTVIAPRGYRAAIADRPDIAVGEGPPVGGIETVLIAKRGVRISLTHDQPFPTLLDPHTVGLRAVLDAETTPAD